MQPGSDRCRIPPAGRCCRDGGDVARPPSPALRAAFPEYQGWRIRLTRMTRPPALTRASSTRPALFLTLVGLTCACWSAASASPTAVWRPGSQARATHHRHAALPGGLRPALVFCRLASYRCNAAVRGRGRCMGLGGGGGAAHGCRRAAAAGDLLPITPEQWACYWRAAGAGGAVRRCWSPIAFALPPLGRAMPASPAPRCSATPCCPRPTAPSRTACSAAIAVGLASGAGRAWWWLTAPRTAASRPWFCVAALGHAGRCSGSAALRGCWLRAGRPADAGAARLLGPDRAWQPAPSRLRRRPLMLVSVGLGRVDAGLGGTDRGQYRRAGGLDQVPTRRAQLLSSSTSSPTRWTCLPLPS